MPPQNRRRPVAGATPSASKPTVPPTPPVAAAKADIKKAAAKPKKRSWTSDFTTNAGSFFGDQVADAEARNGGVLVGNEAERVCIGVPLKAFSLQYIHTSDTYPLGRMEMQIGESDSCKTAYLFEKMRWFLREPGAGAVYELNEARDPADLRASIIGDELLSDGRFRLEGPCESLENWQRNVTAMLHKFENTFKQSGGCAFPLIIGLDSITGTTNERVIAAIDEHGCAQLTFGQDANLLNMYSKYLFQRLCKWPISFVTTSHIKYKSDKYSNKIMSIPGGDALRYVSTYITHLKKMKDIDRLDVAGGRRLELKMIKAQGEHRSIQVDFVWHYDEATGKQQSTWNWHGATVELLAGFSGDRKKALDEIITFPQYNKTTQTASCPEVGFKKAAPWDEVGQAIMETPKVLKGLQDYFGVKRRRVFEVGVPYNEQIKKAIADGQVEAHSMADVTVPVDRSGDETAEEVEVEVPVQE